MAESDISAECRHRRALSGQDIQLHINRQRPHLYTSMVPTPDLLSSPAGGVYTRPGSPQGAEISSVDISRSSTNNTTTAALPPSQHRRHSHHNYHHSDKQHSSSLRHLSSSSSLSNQSQKSTAPSIPPVDKMVIVSGGTGANSIVGAFVAIAKKCNFVLPISDDGGSSSEIIRVLGGPSIGDIRSRLVRLIPHCDETCINCRESSEYDATQSWAIANLLSYRLVGSTAKVKTEWRSIVEGRHPLWRGIGQDRKECIRSFLVHFDWAVLQRARRRFSFKNCSVGNAYLSGALLFFRNIESAIFLFATLTGISPNYQCTPVINTTSVATIGAELEDGNVIVGQCQISHPPEQSSSSSNSKQIKLPRAKVVTTTPPSQHLRLVPSVVGVIGAGDDDLHGHDIQSADEQIDDDPYFQPSPTDNANVVFSKDHVGSIGINNNCSSGTDQSKKTGSSTATSTLTGLSSRVKRIFYINAYGQEVYPKPNPKYIHDLRNASMLVYSCGSLFTSIIPCLSLRGVASEIATSATLKYKILLLNATNDRETPKEFYSCASDFVKVIYDTCTMMDASCDENLSDEEGDDDSVAGEVEDIVKSRLMNPAVSWDHNDFVTHVLYLDEGNIYMDVEELTKLGIKPVPVKTYIDDQGRPLFEESNVLEAMMSIIHEQQ